MPKVAALDMSLVKSRFTYEICVLIVISVIIFYFILIETAPIARAHIEQPPRFAAF